MMYKIGDRVKVNGEMLTIETVSAYGYTGKPVDCIHIKANGKKEMRLIPFEDEDVEA